VVVPTTLLSQQHFRSFSERFAGLPLRIAQLSRLVPAKDARRSKEELTEGAWTLLSGPALLAKDVRCAPVAGRRRRRHFGVAQGKLKQLKPTLCADPDRDANPARLRWLSGVREMNFIASRRSTPGGAHFLPYVR
jgi:transcription-repair coupling factor (superfamily II helicase)